jgi:two-component sensor histidine kinase
MNRDASAEFDGVVLCVGRDEEIARAAHRVFRRDGGTVIRADDAAAGLATVGCGDVAAVVLALGTGASSAEEFLQAVNSLPEPPPVVCVAASTDLEIAINALKAGAAGFVVKTAGPDFEVQLLAALQQALAQARLHREKDRAHSEVLEARDRAVALLGQVNHRIANSLALVVSLARMQAAATPDAMAKSALAEAQARIAAVANVHRTLYASEDILVVDLAAYLSAVVDELRHSIAAENQGATLTVHAVNAQINTERAVAIGMIATELITNAIKYAYPDASGEVRLLFERFGAAGFILAIEDDGVGLTKDSDSGAALGGRIVRAMARSLDTELTYETRPTGTRAVIPLAADLFLDAPPVEPRDSQP